jgi:hypothetical protein
MSLLGLIFTRLSATPDKRGNLAENAINFLPYDDQL